MTFFVKATHFDYYCPSLIWSIQLLYIYGHFVCCSLLGCSLFSYTQLTPHRPAQQLTKKVFTLRAHKRRSICNKSQVVHHRHSTASKASLIRVFSVCFRFSLRETFDDNRNHLVRTWLLKAGYFKLDAWEIICKNSWKERILFPLFFLFVFSSFVYFIRLSATSSHCRL